MFTLPDMGMARTPSMACRSPQPAARSSSPFAVACFTVCYANQLFATVAIAVLFEFAWVAAGRIFVEMDSFKFSPMVPKK